MGQIEREAQAGSDERIIAVVVAKCSSLIIPPSFAHEAAPHLHINGNERRVRCQGLQVKRVAKLQEHTGHHPYNKHNPPASPDPPTTTMAPPAVFVYNKQTKQNR